MDETDSVVTIQCSGNRRIQTMKSLLNKFPESSFAELLRHAEVADGQENGIKLNYADRSSQMVVHVLNALRHKSNAFVLPDNFDQFDELMDEVKFANLPKLEEQLRKHKPRKSRTISISYHATLTVGKQGMTHDVNFRKILRILVAGKMSDCKKVFGNTLNQGRDGDMGEDRYTSRVYLKHTFVEQAFDALALAGYKLVGSTSHAPSPTHSKDELECYMHYSQFIFKKEKQ